MDTAVNVAIITGVFSVITTGLTIYYNNKYKRQVELKEKFDESINNSLKLPESSYAYTIRTLTRKVKINPDGSAAILNICEGIRPTQTIRDLTIPYLFRVEGKNAHIHEPKLKETTNSALSAVFKSSVIQEYPHDTKELSGSIVFYGHCDENTKELGYSFEHYTESSYAMTKEDALRLYQQSDWKEEYWSSRTLVPTEELKMVLKFPKELKNLSVNPRPFAFVGSTHLVSDKETKRISNFFSFTEGLGGSKEASLDIKNPQQGIVYAISWMPPSKSEG